MGFRTTARYDLDALTSASGAGSYTKMIYCKDFRHAVFTLVNSGSSATMTVKFYISNTEARPDLSSAASASNEYSTVQVIDLKTGTAVNGDTGLAISADGIGTYEVNINEAVRVGMICTAWTKGTCTPSILLADNQ